MKENIARQLREDAIESGHPLEFRVGMERLHDMWLDSLFEERKVDYENIPGITDPAFVDLMEGIMIDSALMKLYMAISFSKASDEAVRRGMVKNRANTILRKALVLLSEKQTKEEMMQVNKIFIEELRQEYKKSVTQSYSKRINDAIEAIHFGKHKKMSAAIVAEELGQNKVSLSKQFKRETGVTLTDYILSVKMEEAEKMQKKGIYSNEEICDALDFPSYAYFSRRYKQYFGCAPSRREYD